MREGVSSMRVAFIYGKFAIIVQSRIVLWPRRVQPVVAGIFCHANGLEVLLSTARNAFRHGILFVANPERVTALNYPARRQQFNTVLVSRVYIYNNIIYFSSIYIYNKLLI